MMDRFSIEELESMLMAYDCMVDHKSFNETDIMMYEMIQRRLEARQSKTV